jgi:2-C-methyl-D-erythritol 2,4-cyclodiphosphate synthase
MIRVYIRMPVILTSQQNKGDYMFKVAIGQDSHRFDFDNHDKKLVLGGVFFDGPPLKGNSDADVVLHALTNAISGITGVNILGETADKLCLEQGITDSSVYVREALKYLNGEICHVSFSVECLKPKISPKIPDMKKSIARLLNIDEKNIGITATTGEGLTDFGKGLGIQCFCILTALVK